MTNFSTRVLKTTSCYSAVAALIATSFPTFAFTPVEQRTYLPDNAPLPWLQHASTNETIEIARILPDDSLPWLESGTSNNQLTPLTQQPNFSQAIAGARKISPIQARQLEKQQADYAYSAAEPAVFTRAAPCRHDNSNSFMGQTELVSDPPQPIQTDSPSAQFTEISGEIDLPVGNEATDDPFAQLARNNTVSDADLSEMRGAFVSSNGMVIDFGLVTQTVINGDTVRQLDIASSQLNQINAADLQTLIQVTEQNIDVQQLGINDLPGVLTVIQNNANDQLIQNFNVLNLEVQNVRNFRAQLLVPQINDALTSR